MAGSGQPADYRDDELDLVDDDNPELDLLDDLEEWVADRLGSSGTPACLRDTKLAKSS